MFPLASESTERDANARLAHVAAAARVRDASAQHVSQGNGCRVVQLAHIRSASVAEHGKSGIGRKPAGLQPAEPLSYSKK